MAKVQILGSAAVVTSTVKAEDLDKLRKFKPASLKLIDKETKDELFAIGFGCSPSFTNHGVVFTGRNEENAAQVTLQLPEYLHTVEDKKKYVSDTYGYALLSLNKLESQIADTLEVVADDFATIDASIEAL
jgi:hypothetical protein